MASRPLPDEKFKLSGRAGTRPSCKTYDLAEGHTLPNRIVHERTLEDLLAKPLKREEMQSSREIRFSRGRL